MKYKLLSALIIVGVFYSFISHGQTLSTICVAGTNSQNQSTCIPVSASNPLPTTSRVNTLNQVGLFGDSWEAQEIQANLPIATANASNTGAASITLVGCQPSCINGTWVATLTDSTHYNLVNPKGATVLTGVGTGVGQSTTPRTMDINVSTGGNAGDSFNIVSLPYRWYGYDARSAFFWANSALGFPFQLAADTGVSSTTTAQMLSFFGNGTNADPYIYPNVHVWILGSIGINDTGSGVPLATMESNVKQILTNLTNSGAVAIISSIPNQSSFTGNTTQVALRNLTTQYNQWLAQYAAKTKNVIYWNQKRYLVNPSTGFFYAAGEYAANSPAYSQDGVHRNYPGGLAASRGLAPILQSLTPGLDFLDNDTFVFSQDYFGNTIQSGNSSPTPGGGANTSGAVAGAGITATAVPNMTSIYVRGTGTAVATKTTQTGPFTDQGSQLVISTSAARDGAQWLWGGDGTAAVGRWDKAHVTNTAYNVGEKTNPSGATANNAFNGLTGLVTTAGTTGATEPTYPTVAGQTIADGTATLTMIPSPGPFIWAANFFFGATPVTFFTTSNSTVYFQTSGACETAGSLPGAYATAVVGTVVTDNTCTMTAIVPPTYSYYAQVDYTLSGMVQGKGVGMYFNLQMLDTTNAAVDTSGVNVCGPCYDLSGTASPPAQYLPASGTLRTPNALLQPFKRIRYLFPNLLVNGDAGQSTITVTAYRPTTNQVITP